ncbi:hypothetical protein EVAR_22955_1 [Eumeta japonica]|uniref:Uncharacterized protein n=1 Tax=Eumeta variegata TaxID=151549 RepID=A0A4C1UR88_EUMVA|nr:hypothetical protein EVAR_22955_1 [Eumeta japonica]
MSVYCTSDTALLNSVSCLSLFEILNKQKSRRLVNKQSQNVDGGKPLNLLVTCPVMGQMENVDFDAREARSTSTGSTEKYMTAYHMRRLGAHLSVVFNTPYALVDVTAVFSSGCI